MAESHDKPERFSVRANLRLVTILAIWLGASRTVLSDDAFAQVVTVVVFGWLLFSYIQLGSLLEQRPVLLTLYILAVVAAVVAALVMPAVNVS